jgi:hypothetical protein
LLLLLLLCYWQVRLAGSRSQLAPNCCSRYSSGVSSPVSQLLLLLLLQ